MEEAKDTDRKLIAFSIATCVVIAILVVILAVLLGNYLLAQYKAPLTSPSKDSSTNSKTTDTSVSHPLYQRPLLSKTSPLLSMQAMAVPIPEKSAPAELWKKILILKSLFT